MSTIEKVYKEITRKYDLFNLYRYQNQNINGYSFKHLTIDKELEIKENGNIYFSKSYEHHKYFIKKRIKQEANVFLKQKKLPIISKTNMLLIDEYNQIKTALIEHYTDFNSEAINLTTIPFMAKLLKENSVQQEIKRKHPNTIELADRRKQGGSYGIPNNWLTLLNGTTLFYGKKNINYDDILNYLYCLKLNYAAHSKNDVLDFLNHKNASIYINENLYNPYHKYTILDNLEKIIEENNYLKTSCLNKQTTKTIRGCIEEYQQLREVILNTMEDKYKRKVLK